MGLLYAFQWDPNFKHKKKNGKRNKNQIVCHVWEDMKEYLLFLLLLFLVAREYCNFNFSESDGIRRFYMYILPYIDVIINGTVQSQ